MKKYLGSQFTAYAAIISPLFVCLPIFFGTIILLTEVSIATIFLAIGCVACSLIWGIYLKGVANQLYTWGIFKDNGVRIKTVFSKESFMFYKNCRGCGIGFYNHRALNSKFFGTRVYFIFLSYDAFDETCRSQINLWKPSKEKIKVKFNKDLYEYLIDVLPKKQSLALRRDYEKYIVIPKYL